MTHTKSFKSEIYLIVTSSISIGVLIGYEYFNFILAALLIIPFINFWVKKIFNKDKQNSTNLIKCAHCK
jgi:hypothetical protein